MSDGAPLRAVAFGTADGSLYGTAIDLGRPAVVLGVAGAGAGIAYHLEWSEESDGSWRIEGDGVALTITPEPAPEPVAPVAEQAEPGEHKEHKEGEEGEEGETPPPVLPAPGPDDPVLCRVTGTVHVDGELTVDCAGVRVLVAAPKSAKAAPVSARLVAGWLEDGGAFALSAVRPRNGSHHDDDLVTAALFDPERWVGVTDPRLSTTYDRDGVPTRANLELWVGHGDNEFPRRAAGEASGDETAVNGDGVALRASQLSCHSRGREGAGVYALATFS
jgi:hypothetical protein